jgi:hypothetical protein
VKDADGTAAGKLMARGDNSDLVDITYPCMLNVNILHEEVVVNTCQADVPGCVTADPAPGEHAAAGYRRAGATRPAPAPGQGGRQAVSSGQRPLQRDARVTGRRPQAAGRNP